MQKILLIVENTRHDLNALDFACYLSKLTHSKLTGVFLEDIQHKNRRVSGVLHRMPYSESIESTNLPPVRQKLQSIEQTVEFFKQAASDRGVNCNVLRYKLTVTVTLALYLQSKTATDVISIR